MVERAGQRGAALRLFLLGVVVVGMGALWIANSRRKSAGSTAIDAPRATARAERLERDRQHLRAVVDCMEEFGGIKRMRAAIKALPDGWEQRAWAPTEDGVLKTDTLKYFLHWNAPGLKSGVPRAIDFEQANHPFHDIVARARVLAEHGVDFLLVCVPNRLQIYPELVIDVDAGREFCGFDLGLARFELALAEAGVEVVDLLSVFAEQKLADPDEPLFLRHDHHWTARGAEVAAEVIAERIAELDWFERGPAREGIDFEVRREDVRWTGPLHRELRKTARPMMMDVNGIVRADGVAAHAADRASPIVVLGDSSATYHSEIGADVCSQLYARLGLPLDVIAIPALDAGEVWKTMNRRADALEGKRLVIRLIGAGFRAPDAR